MSNKITGSIGDLDRKFKIGDFVLGQPELSVLTRLGKAAGFARVIEERKRPDGKGRPSLIWEIDADFAGKIVPYGER